MKRIKGLQEAQKVYNWCEKVGYNFEFYFQPHTGKLVCEYYEKQILYVPPSEEWKILGWFFVDIDAWLEKRGCFLSTKDGYWGRQTEFWAEYHKNWGNRAMFQEIKRVIGENWPEYKESKK